VALEAGFNTGLLFFLSDIPARGIPGQPPVMGILYLLNCVALAGDQGLVFIRHNATAGACHGTIHQPATRAVHGKYVKERSTNDATVDLTYMTIFRRAHDYPP